MKFPLYSSAAIGWTVHLDGLVPAGRIGAARFSCRAKGWGAAKRIATPECTLADTDQVARETEMARPERFELPTTWFEVSQIKSSHLYSP